MTLDRRTAPVATAAVPNRKVPTATAEQRRKRTGLLRDDRPSQQDKLLRLVAQAKDNEDRMALGFTSWTRDLPTEAREEVTSSR
jgi:hypothetical protein